MNRLCYVTTLGLSVKSFFVPQLKYLSQNGYSITVICSPDIENLKDLLGEDIELINIDIPRGISFFNMLKTISKLRRIFKDHEFDLIQYSTPNASLCAAIAGIQTNIPVRNYHLMGYRFLGSHGVLLSILKLLEKLTCKLSTSIECVSESNREYGVQQGLFDEKKATVVYKGSSGGIDLTRYDYKKRDIFRKEIRDKYQIDENAFVFGFVGRITKDKGVNEILKAFSQLEDSILLMVGFQDEISTIDQHLYEQSLSNPNIIYTGAVDDVEKYYSAMDVLLLPSYREGFGNVVIESAAMGTPAIVSEIPGPIDTSIKNKTAIWIQARNVESLREAMRRSRICAYTMRNDCIEYSRECFDQEILNKYILERKNKLLGKTKDSQRR